MPRGKPKPTNPPPDQPSMTAFLTGGAKSWQPGDSPLMREGSEIRKSSDQSKFEAEVHLKFRYYMFRSTFQSVLTENEYPFIP